MNHKRALKIGDRPSSPPYEGGDKGEVGNILKTPTPSLISPFIRGRNERRFSLFLFDLKIMSYF
ncbi:hypothetical protein L0244_32500, partial [bacterium]|nr:hypothetical protein [bacterium]